MTISPSSPVPAAVAPREGRAVRFGTIYTLVALMILNAFHLGDRALIAVLQEPIKGEFHLSDLQLGLLTGPAFAFVFTLCGLPIARLAERRSRVAIIASSMAMWSALTAVCGVTTTYVQLVAARMGVGVGESGFTPAAHALIADTVPLERRAMALSLFSLGQPLGVILLSVIGAVAAQALGWRGAFLVLGIPGVVLAIVVFLTVREPDRTAQTTQPVSFWATLKALLAKPTFRNVMIGGVIAQLGMSVLFYVGSFLIRAYGLGLTQVAMIQSAIPALMGAIGIVLGGIAVDRLARRDARWTTRLPAIGLFLAGPLWALAFMAPSLPLYIALFMPACLVQSPTLPIVFAVGQNVAQPRSRATASALLLLATILIGQGLGAPAIGLLSDLSSHVFMVRAGVDPLTCATGARIPVAHCADAVAEGLRWALAAFGVLPLIAGFFLLLAGRSLSRDEVTDIAS
ncbi:spinster family MFS transporter [Novosphingobium sp. BL-52-GroH]|uniref:spinster family MFS transporter n=1 Tax=Novosphingobium sp. BL-52-GroH TaxID=3349877 RepID=UPI00384C4159